MISLDFDYIDIQRFQKKMRAYPSVIGREFRGLISSITQLGKREIMEAVRSGETRAFDTGNLFKLIQGQMIDSFTGEISSNAPYSLFVHSGTKYMRARPYMSKGLKNAENKFNDLIESFLDKVFNKI